MTVFIIEILKSYEWERSRQFPNYYTEGEADDILRRNPSLTISGDFLDYRKREIEYDEPASETPQLGTCKTTSHGTDFAIPIGEKHSYSKACDNWSPNPVKPCTRPPFGWRCTRGFHEDGPCAAVPINPSWLGKTIPSEVRQKLDALTRVPRIGTVATPSDGLMTWKMLDCPKCLQRITVDVTDVVTRVTGN